MPHNLSHLLDFLFPPSEDEMRIRAAAPIDFKLKLNIQHIHPGLIALASFKDPQVRAAVHLLKFHNNSHAALLLSALFSAYLEQTKQQPLVIPVPLSPKRYRERGHNQVHTFCKLCEATHPKLEIRTDLLKKTKHTKPQSSLSVEERKGNVTGVFSLTAHAHTVLANKHVIVLDDVVTTGHTLLQAKAELQKAQPASLLCVALAH